MATTPFILMAEDEVNDAILVGRALRKITPAMSYHVVKNGEEAIAYITGEGEYADRTKFPAPSILLLDLKMPRKGGLEVLQWLHDHPQYAIVPTIVWSSSRLPRDVQEAYSLGATCFIVKPSSYTEIYNTLEKTFEFWRMCERPSASVLASAAIP